MVDKKYPTKPNTPTTIGWIVSDRMHKIPYQFKDKRVVDGPTCCTPT